MISACYEKKKLLGIITGSFFSVVVDKTMAGIGNETTFIGPSRSGLELGTPLCSK